MPREDKEAGVLVPLPKIADRFEPAGAGKWNIHDHNVRHGVAIGLVRGLRTIRLADDAKAGLTFAHFLESPRFSFSRQRHASARRPTRTALRNQKLFQWMLPPGSFAIRIHWSASASV